MLVAIFAFLLVIPSPNVLEDSPEEYNKRDDEGELDERINDLGIESIEETVNRISVRLGVSDQHGLVDFAATCNES